MKILGLILAGLCIGWASGTIFDFFTIFNTRYPSESNPSFNEWEFYCRQIMNTFSSGKMFNAQPYNHIRIAEDFFQKHCVTPTEVPKSSTVSRISNKNLSEGRSFKHTSAETPSSIELDRIPVSTEVSSDSKVSDILRSMTKDTNPKTPEDFSKEASSSLKTTADGTNPEISDGSVEVSNKTEKTPKITNSKSTSDSFTKIVPKETGETTEITSPKVSVDSSSTQEIEKSTEMKNTNTSDDSTIEISKTTDVSREISSSTAPDVQISDVNTTEVTSDVTNSMIPDKKDHTETTKETDGTSVVKDSTSNSTPVTTISKVTSGETTLVTDSLKTSSGTETSKPEISVSTFSTEATTEKKTSDVSSSTTPNTVFVSTDLSTSGKTNSDAESSSTTAPSSSIRPDVISTTGFYSTERGSTDVNTSPQSQETTVDNVETTHTITTIELQGTRTLKLAVSITFLVIALLALVVLVVYFIATRRRTFSYDELMLLP